MRTRVHRRASGTATRHLRRECDILQHPDYPGGGEDPSFPLTVAFRDQRGAERIDIHPNATGPVLGKGCIVGGVPIGDAEFVRVHLAETVSDAVSKSRNISLMLQSDCLHTLHTLNIRCLQPILSYWTQHCSLADRAALRGFARLRARLDRGALLDT